MTRKPLDSGGSRMWVVKVPSLWDEFFRRLVAKGDIGTFSAALRDVIKKGLRFYGMKE